MPDPKAKPVPPAPTARTEEPVRIFSVGQTLPSGKIADQQFIDQAVANWTNYQVKGDPRFKRPRAFVIPAASVAVGHEANSSIAKTYAQRTDLPAVGWPTQVWRDGKFLMAHLKGIPAGLASWIQAGAYGDRSAEFYEDYEGFGPCLRRISILGGEIPACADLGDMPTLVFDPDEESEPNVLAFSETLSAFAAKHRRFAVGLGPSHVVTFSESTPLPGKRTATMTPQQQALFDALGKLGVDTTKLDPVTLDAILASVTPTPPVAANAAPAPPTPAVPKNPMQCAEDDKDEIAVNAEGDVVDKDSKEKAATFSEKQWKAIGGLVRKSVAGVATKAEGAIARLDTAGKIADRAVVATFCETHKDKIFPAELEPKVGPTLIDRLLNLSADTVATFAEGKLSPRAAEMAAIAARPPVAKFAEKMAAAPISQQGDAATEAQRLLGLTHVGKGAQKLATAGK